MKDERSSSLTQTTDGTLSLRERAHRVIPGGAHTYAKGDDQFPEEAPPVLVRGDGCRVWDDADNTFIEYGMGLRSVALGHAHPRVTQAAIGQLRLGANFTRPARIEIECAEMLAHLVGADMVKFCKDGSTATTAAVRVARAYTGRDLVAFCSDHPFFSYDDWFIGATPMNAGIPHAIRALTFDFRYNDLASLEALFEAHPGSVACVILEAERTEPPEDGFLGGVQDLCARHGAILVLDEMITGFRWHLGGAQAYYGLTPDLSVFGKAMANGFSLSALTGRREIMELGGLRHDDERVFLLSTTHGAETHALAAAIETMTVYREENIIDALWRAGSRLADGVRRAAAECGLQDAFSVLGKPPNLVYATKDRDGRPSQTFRTLFLQEMLGHGFIAPSFVISAAHDDSTIDQTIEAVGAVLQIYAMALEQGPDKFLRGPSVKPVYRRFN